MNALGDFCVPILGIFALVCAAAVFLYFSCIRKNHVRSTFNAEDTESASLPERYPQFFRDPHLLDDSPDPVDEPVTNIPENTPPPPVEKPHMLPPEPPEHVFALKPPSAATQAAQDNLNHKLWHQLVWIIPNTQWLQTQQQSLTYVQWLCLGPDHHYFIAQAELHQNEWHWRFTKA